jgi:pantetheine-phosphate adenylyltransferase
MKQAIYAGSFDPWSFGHQFVLESALQVFDRVHILAAVNPAKLGEFDPQTRTRAIAHAINPVENWWSHIHPFEIGKNIVITATTGLVVDYARQHGIEHLIRGLRSTSDFESEFNLYFSNRAIHSEIQTWCIMCPPELLHCSSTFVRSVVGAQQVQFVGTAFVNQAILLGWSRAVGHLLDLVQALSRHRFEKQPADITTSTLNAALQRVFLLLKSDPSLGSEFHAALEKAIVNYLSNNAARVQKSLSENQYPEQDVHQLWAILIGAIAAPQTGEKAERCRAQWAGRISQPLGKTGIPLFCPERVRAILEDAAS